MAVRERFIDDVKKTETLVKVDWSEGAERIFNESYDSVVHLNDDEDESVSDDSLSQMSEEGSKDIHDDTSEEIV